MFARHSVAEHAAPAAGQGRQEEAHASDVQRSADIRSRENIRTDQVLGGTGARQAGVRPRHDRVTSEGECVPPTYIRLLHYFCILARLLNELKGSYWANTGIKTQMNINLHE